MKVRKMQTAAGGGIYLPPWQESESFDVALARFNQQKKERDAHIMDRVKQAAKSYEATTKRETNDYLTTSNSSTARSGGRKQNTHLEERFKKGAKQQAIWRQEHPNLAAWGDVATMAPFAVLAYPALTAAGDAIAATSAGQTITSGLNFLANAAKTSPLFPYAEGLLASGFAADGIRDISQGKFTPGTALEILPLVRPVEEGVKFADKLAKELYYGPLGKPTVSQGFATLQPKVITNTGSAVEQLMTYNHPGQFVRRVPKIYEAPETYWSEYTPGTLMNNGQEQVLLLELKKIL